MDKQYRDLNEQFTEDIFDNAAEQTKPAYVQQNKDQEQLLSMVAKVLLSYTIIDSVLSLSSNDRKNLTNKFNTSISSIAKSESNTENNLMNNILTNAVKNKYYTDAYITQLGIDFKLQKITDAEIKKVIGSKVEGKNWSDRLWDNKGDLQNNLQKSIGSFLKGDINVNQIEKDIKKKFNQNAYNTHRLVQSEVARCQNEANDIFAENHDVEYQMYTATLEGHTCGKCAELDGQVYRLDDDNKPPIPKHPLCRCCYINLPDKDWRPNLRRDQENDTIEDWTNYQDWYNKNVENNVNSDIIRLPDTQIGRSVGAKAKNYNIKLPNGEYVHLVEGTKITGSTVIAGKGKHRQIDELDVLVADYGGDPDEWQKVKGFGYVNYDGEELKAELHWYQEPSVGKVKMKIKPQRDGEPFIYED